MSKRSKRIEECDEYEIETRIRRTIVDKYEAKTSTIEMDMRWIRDGYDGYEMDMR